MKDARQRSKREKTLRLTDPPTRLNSSAIFCSSRHSVSTGSTELPLCPRSSRDSADTLSCMFSSICREKTQNAREDAESNHKKKDNHRQPEQGRPAPHGVPVGEATQRHEQRPYVYQPSFISAYSGGGGIATKYEAADSTTGRAEIGPFVTINVTIIHYLHFRVERAAIILDSKLPHRFASLRGP